MAVRVDDCIGEQAELSVAKSPEDSGAAWPGETFRCFFLEHYNRVATVVFRIVGDYARAEDLTTEAFWRLYCQAWNGYGKFNPSGWLYRTATRLAIDSLRAEARRGRYEQEAGPSVTASSPPDPLGNVLEAERRAQVRRALALLRPRHAQLLILRASGFSYQELADTLGIKRGSVGTRLIRAEAAFRKPYLGLHGK